MNRLLKKFIKSSLLLILAAPSNLSSVNTDILTFQPQKKLEQKAAGQKQGRGKNFWKWIKNHRARAGAVFSGLGVVVVGSVLLFCKIANAKAAAKIEKSNRVSINQFFHSQEAALSELEALQTTEFEEPTRQALGNQAIIKGRGSIRITADLFSCVFQGLSGKDLDVFIKSSRQMLHNAAYCVVKHPMSINNLSPNLALNMLEMGMLTPEELGLACQSNPKLLASDLSKSLILRGHEALIGGIAWSLDGRQFASGSEDCTVRIWNLATGQEQRVLRGHGSWVNIIAFSPDGSKLVSGSEDDTVRIWDPATGQELHVLRGHTRAVKSIAWSPDGSKLASCSKDGKVRIWDSVTGQELHVLRDRKGPVNRIAWSPDGRQFAYGSEYGTVRIWNPATGQEQCVLRGHIDWVKSIAWSPDGSKLASGSEDGTVRTWNPATGQGQRVLRGHTRSVKSIAWSPNGSKLASCSSDYTVRIWESVTGKELLILRDPAASVKSIAWSPDGSKLASCSWDGTVRIWDPVTGQELHFLRGRANRIEWSPDSRQLASGSKEKTIRIWGVNALPFILSTYQAGQARRIIEV